MSDLNSALERLEHAVQRVRMGTSRLSNDVNDLANDVRASAETVRSHAANHALMMNLSSPSSSSSSSSTLAVPLANEGEVSSTTTAAEATPVATAAAAAAATATEAAFVVEDVVQSVQVEEANAEVIAGRVRENNTGRVRENNTGRVRENNMNTTTNSGDVLHNDNFVSLNDGTPTSSFSAAQPLSSSSTFSSTQLPLSSSTAAATGAAPPSSFTYVRYSSSPALREAAVSGYTGLVRSPLSVAADVDPFQVRQPGYSLSSGDGSISMLRDTERGRTVVASSALLQSLALTALSEVIQASIAGAAAAATGGGGGGASGGNGGATGEGEES